MLLLAVALTLSSPGKVLMGEMSRRERTVYLDTKPELEAVTSQR